MHAIDRPKPQVRGTSLWALGFGLELAAYFWLGFDLFPHKVDPWLGTAPVFKILGYIVGIGCPINALVRIARDYNRDLKRDEPSDKPNP